MNKISSIEIRQINKHSSTITLLENFESCTLNNTSLKIYIHIFEKIFPSKTSLVQQRTRFSSSRRAPTREEKREKEKDGERGSRESGVSGSCRPFCAIVARCFECSRTLENTLYCPAPGDPTITRIEIPISSASLLLRPPAAVVRPRPKPRVHIHRGRRKRGSNIIPREFRSSD